MAEDKYDCALSALWAEGVRLDVRGTTKRWAGELCFMLPISSSFPPASVRWIHSWYVPSGSAGARIWACPSATRKRA